MMLYGIDVAKTPVDAAVRGFFEAFGDGAPIDPGPAWDRAPAYRVYAPRDRFEEARAFAADRVRGVREEQVALDRRVQETSRRWRMERMAIIDRNILRLGAFEILHRGAEVPRKVAINEAVELAKTFGAAESGAFVNGLLDRIESPS